MAHSMAENQAERFGIELAGQDWPSMYQGHTEAQVFRLASCFVSHKAAKAAFPAYVQHLKNLDEVQGIESLSKRGIMPREAV